MYIYNLILELDGTRILKMALARILLQLLSNLQVPSHYNTTFDIFFTSHKLLCRLNSLGYFATGTVRENRTNQAPLNDIKSMKKTVRGSSDFRFDVRMIIL